MPRKHFLPSSIAPYHVVARTSNKENFEVPPALLWEIFSDYLFFIATTYQVEIISFILMSNHYHMLVRTPQANLPEAMNYLQREISRQINRYSGRINQVFGGPYSWSLITREQYLFNVYKYIYRNSVDAGVCKLVEEYRYSTLHGLLGLSKLSIPMAHDSILFADVEDRLAWLNQPFARQAMRGEIRAALKHRQFEFGKDRDRNRAKQPANSTTTPEKVRGT